MTIPASHCEAILRGMSKRADKDGDWIQVVWQIHPNDVPQALWNADLRSRWQLAFVEIDDQEQPVAPSASLSKPQQVNPSQRKPAATHTRSQWSAIRGIDYQWRHWAGLPDAWDEAAVSEWLRQKLGIQSRKELDSNPVKAAAWDKLDASFIEATRLPERH